MVLHFSPRLLFSPRPAELSSSRTPRCFRTASGRRRSSCESRLGPSAAADPSPRSWWSPVGWAHLGKDTIVRDRRRPWPLNPGVWPRRTEALGVELSAHGADARFSGLLLLQLSVQEFLQTHYIDSGTGGVGDLLHPGLVLLGPHPAPAQVLMNNRRFDSSLQSTVSKTNSTLVVKYCWGCCRSPVCCSHWGQTSV